MKESSDMATGRSVVSNAWQGMFARFRDLLPTSGVRYGRGAGAAWRKVVILAAMGLAWEIAVVALDVNPLLFPRFSDVALDLLHGVGLFGGEGQYWSLAWTTLEVLLESYALALALGAVMTSLAVGNVWGRELLTTLTAVFQPLPSIALLPLAILWFGLGTRALIFVVIMSMVWPISAALTVGFATVPETLLRVGRNFELGRVRMIWSIMLPMALPAALSGARVGWGYGWRTVVAAELVFGAAGGKGGLGWFINNARLFLNVTGSLSAILVIIIIGLATESMFGVIQRVTTQRWGMERA